jgi:hypothetical protein
LALAVENERRVLLSGRESEKNAGSLEITPGAEIWTDDLIRE